MFLKMLMLMLLMIVTMKMKKQNHSNIKNEHVENEGQNKNNDKQKHNTEIMTSATKTTTRQETKLNDTSSIIATSRMSHSKTHFEGQLSIAPSVPSPFAGQGGPNRQQEQQWPCDSRGLHQFLCSQDCNGAGWCQPWLSYNSGGGRPVC